MTIQAAIADYQHRRGDTLPRSEALFEILEDGTEQALDLSAYQDITYQVRRAGRDNELIASRSVQEGNLSVNVNVVSWELEGATAHQGRWKYRNLVG